MLTIFEGLNSCKLFENKFSEKIAYSYQMVWNVKRIWNRQLPILLVWPLGYHTVFHPILLMNVAWVHKRAKSLNLYTNATPLNSNFLFMIVSWMISFQLQFLLPNFLFKTITVIIWSWNNLIRHFLIIFTWKNINFVRILKYLLIFFNIEKKSFTLILVSRL